MSKRAQVTPRSIRRAVDSLRPRADGGRGQALPANAPGKGGLLEGARHRLSELVDRVVKELGALESNLRETVESSPSKLLAQLDLGKKSLAAGVDAPVAVVDAPK